MLGSLMCPLICKLASPQLPESHWPPRLHTRINMASYSISSICWSSSHSIHFSRWTKSYSITWVSWTISTSTPSINWTTCIIRIVNWVPLRIWRSMEALHPPHSTPLRRQKITLPLREKSHMIPLSHELLYRGSRFCREWKYKSVHLRNTLLSFNHPHGELFLSFSPSYQRDHNSQFCFRLNFCEAFLNSRYSKVREFAPLVF